MIRLAPAFALLALAACTHPDKPVTTDAGPAQPVATGQCHADRVQDLIGRERSETVGKDALTRSGAATLRWIPLGAMVTMDYREDRLNLRLGPYGKITAVNCG